MAEPNQHREEESLEAPEKLVDALNLSRKERIFVPPTVDLAVLQRAREHLRRLERPQSRRKPSLAWAAMAACLALAIWVGERFSNPTRPRPFAREDINRDGRVDILDAFALARQIETGGTLNPRWDINGDGRVDRADVNAIAARAVDLAQAEPVPKRNADLKQHREGAHAVWRTEVRAPLFGVTGLGVNMLPASCPQLIGAHRSAELHSISISRNCRKPRRFLRSADSLVRALLYRSFGLADKAVRAPLVAAPPRCAVSESCTLRSIEKLQHVGPIPRPADFKSAIRQIENLRYETGIRRAVKRYPARLASPAKCWQLASENKGDDS